MLRRTVCRWASRREDLLFRDMHGFALVKSRRIDELNLVAYEMQHSATGAKYYHVDTDDTNNTFCIGFRTPAENDKGTSHVLEHTTLCGSKKYPVRDPFFMMLKRSLSSFMNAMTGADYTLYPFSTTNKQDFSNLLDVYLDAVFRPLLREEDFKQEGHRVEVESTAEGQKRLINNGVVYNEMRGVVSEPSQHFARSLMRVMLPETHYTYVSGGYPPDILSLTYEELVSFQKKHYHPSNSATFTYGNHHPESHMKALNEYFSTFESSEPILVPTLPEHCRFKELKMVELEGPLDTMGNPDRQKRITVSYGIEQRKNGIEDVVELSVLDNLLSSGPSSPMYKALIDSHVGSKYAPMRGYAYYLSSPIISYGVAGVDEARAGAEKEVLGAVTGALRTVQKDGFDERRVKSVVFQEELQQRHRAADYGLQLCTGLCAMGLTRSCNDPLDFMNWLPHLRHIEADKGASLLPRIQADLLDNPHTAVVSVSAKKGFLDTLREELKGADDALNASTTTEEKEGVEKRTAEWLARVRAPQNNDVLPTLKISDIPVKAFVEPLPIAASASVAGSSAIYTIPYPTNGLVYVHGLIPFPESLVTALVSAQQDTGVEGVSANIPLLAALLGRTGAGKYSFKELSVESELVCGGFSFSPILNESYRTKGTAIAGTSYGFYTTREKLAEALQLLAVTLLEPRTDAGDNEVASRALSQVKMVCSQSIQSIQHHGNRVAVSRAASPLTRRAQVQERWSGLSHSQHAAQVLEQLQSSEEGSKEAVTRLLSEYAAITAALRDALSHSLLWATCEEGDRAEVEQSLAVFLRQFPASGAATSAEATHLALPVTPASGNPRDAVHEKLPIDTSFVGLAIPNGLSWEQPAQAAVRVACTLLSNEYLHRRVREEGGAYGAGASASLQGEVGGITMSSYRDPTPTSTIKAFEEAAEWLDVPGNVTQARVDEAKLRLFSGLDAPYAADSYGEGYFYNDIRQDMKQQMRDALLGVTPQDVVTAAAYFKPGNHGPASVCVLEPEGDTRDSVSE